MSPRINPFRLSTQYTCYDAAWVARQFGGVDTPNCSGFYQAYCPCCHGPGDKLWLKNAGRRLFVGCYYGCAPAEIHQQINQMVRSGRYTPECAVESRGGDQPRETESSRMAGAAGIWKASSPEVTLLRGYLAYRCIDIDKAGLRWGDLRLHPSLRHPSGQSSPAMVALVRDHNDEPRAIHRTWLAPDGRSKAALDPVRMTLGPVSGCAVRLADADKDLLLGEGIESALSAMQLKGLPGWATLSASGIRAVRLPPSIRCVVIAADHDKVGMEAAWCLCRRLEAEGRRIDIIRPRQEGCDFNDLLRRAPAHG
ncbi:MAG: toprim domain-containing protein [Rhodopila sp.]